MLAWMFCTAEGLKHACFALQKGFTAFFVQYVFTVVTTIAYLPRKSGQVETRSTLQKERLTVHGFGNHISCAFVNAALPYKSVCKYCVHKLQTAVSL